MTQQLPDAMAQMLVNPTAPLAAQQAGIDLLSLRAAVRRWMQADDDVCRKQGWDLGDYEEARAALRAEMAGIDKDEGGKP